MILHQNNVSDSPAGNLSRVHPNRHFLRKAQIFVAHRALPAGLLEDGVLQPDPVHTQTSDKYKMQIPSSRKPSEDPLKTSHVTRKTKVCSSGISHVSTVACKGQTTWSPAETLVFQINCEVKIYRNRLTCTPVLWWGRWDASGSCSSQREQR